MPEKKGMRDKRAGKVERNLNKKGRQTRKDGRARGEGRGGKKITREISKRDVRVSVVGTNERTNERASYSFHGNLI